MRFFTRPLQWAFLLIIIFTLYAIGGSLTMDTKHHGSFMASVRAADNPAPSPLPSPSPSSSLTPVAHATPQSILDQKPPLDPAIQAKLAMTKEEILKQAALDQAALRQSSPPQAARAIAGASSGIDIWILSGGPDPSTPMGVDDELYVYLNGTLIFQSPDHYAGPEPYVEFGARSGDRLQVKAFDYFGFGRGLTPLWLYHTPSGKSFKISDGYDGSFFWPWPAREWFFDQTFTIPEVSMEGDSGFHPAHPTVSSQNCNEPSSGVDLLSGCNLHTDIDITTFCIGPPLEFTRSYSSQWSYNGPLGYGWTHSYNTTLKEQPDGSLTETDEVGTIYSYSKRADGTYASPPGRNVIVTKNADGTFVLTEPTQLKKKFSAQGALLALSDVNNNTMTLSYDAVSGRLTTITDASGRSAVLSYYPDGKISKIVDVAQRQVQYFYEGDNLVRVNDILGLDTKYTYTETHKLATITSFDNKNYSFVYNDQGKVVSKTNYAGDSTGITYDPTTRTSVVIDNRGNSTSYIMDEKGRTLSEIDPYGAETKYEWDDNDNITKITDRRGGIQELTHDDRGNVLTHKDQLGKITAFTYNDRNQITSIKDCLDKMVRLVYDAKGNLLKAIDARGTTVVSCTYNSRGERTSMSDALGHTYHFEFDQYGNVIKSKDPYGKETLAAYDMLDRLTSTTNAKGKTTSFEYGVKDQIIKIIYPDRTSTHYDWYPCCKILKSVVDAKLNGTQYFYDAKRRLIKVADAANGETHLEYDKNDNLTAIIDPKTNRSELSYNKTNLLSRIDYPDGTSESFTYYPDGLLKTKTDGNGVTNSFEYDPVGRLVRKLYPDGSKVDFAYDAVGNRTSMSDSTGTYEYSRDDLYRLIGVKIPSGKSIGYSYNDQGLRTGMIDYDHKKYSYKYDKMNRLQTLILPGNEKIGYEFDVLSNLTKVSYPNNTYSAYTFNDMNRLIKISTMKKGLKEKFISGFDYGYDEVGNRVSMEERQLFGRSRKTTYSFDALYRLTSVSYPNHLDESYSYDLAGNRTILETRKMNYVSCFAGWKWDEKACRKFVYFMFHPEYVTYRVNYSYDRANKLLGFKEIKKTNDKDHLEQTVSYEFDGNGNQVKESILNEGCRKPIENIFGYNFDNRLTSALMKGIKNYEFSYNAAGQRIRTVVGNAKEYGNGEDRNGGANRSRCFSQHSAGNITQHLYDGNSLIIDLDAKGKVVASYSYGLGLRAICSNSLKGFYHSDALGSITEITGKDGNAFRSYRYGAWGALTTGENARDSNPFRYVGTYGVRWQDPTLGLYHMGARYYQAQTGRFISRDRGDPHPYAYALSNPVRFIDPVGLQAENSFTSLFEPVIALGEIGSAASAGAAAGAPNIGQQGASSGAGLMLIPNPWTGTSTLSVVVLAALVGYNAYTHLPANTWMINEPWCPGYQQQIWEQWQQSGYQSGVTWETYLESNGIPPKDYWLYIYGLYPRPPVKPNAPTPPWPPFSSPIMRQILN
jgi:RHS repeat-associated protein